MNKSSKNVIILMAAIFILGSGSLAFAHSGRGYGYSERMYYGQGRHLRSYDSPCYDMFGELTEDQIRQLNEERKTFMDATKDLRRQIYQKQLELASELAKQNPDATAAAAVQQEISGFMAQLAQKRLEHFLRVQKINPDVGRGGPFGFGLMGYGMRHHDMMGPGGYGGWDRPNCPIGGPGGGYGMGPGMMYPGMTGPGGSGAWNCPWGDYGMGPAMRGPAGGYGRGPGMMNREDYRRYHDTQGAPAEKNAGAGEEN
jgi:hypothetical protein